MVELSRVTRLQGFFLVHRLRAMQHGCLIMRLNDALEFLLCSSTPSFACQSRPGKDFSGSLPLVAAV